MVGALKGEVGEVCGSGIGQEEVVKVASIVNAVSLVDHELACIVVDAQGVNETAYGHKLACDF